MNNDPAEATKLLAIYLATTTPAVALGWRSSTISRSELGTPLSSTLGAIRSELVEERDVIVQILQRLGHKPSAFKAAGARVAAEVGRLKLNGRLLRRSPLSDVVKLEGLLGGIQVKQRLWESMSACFGAEAVAAPGWTYRALSIQAGSQHDRLVPHHREAAQRAFGDAASGDDAVLAGTTTATLP